MGEDEAPTGTSDELLEQLAEELRDGGFDVVVVEATESSPAQIVTPVALDGERRALVTTYFVPTGEPPGVLQHFVALPYDVTAPAADLARFVCRVNADLPLTGFEYGEAIGALVFRHTHAVGVDPLDPRVVAWTWAMIDAALTAFGPLVERVAGGLDVDTGVSELVDLLEEMLEA